MRFLAAAKLRLGCKRRGIVKIDVGPEGVAATFLPGRLRKPNSKSLERDGDRVVHASKGHEKLFDRPGDFGRVGACSGRRRLASAQLRAPEFDERDPLEHGRTSSSGVAVRRMDSAMIVT